MDGGGTSVAGAGDVNDDDIADIVIGAPCRHLLTGAVFVAFGRASGFPAKFALSRLNGSNGFRIQGVARRPRRAPRRRRRDINRDHIVDVIIEAPGARPLTFGNVPSGPRAGTRIQPLAKA